MNKAISATMVVLVVVLPGLLVQVPQSAGADPPGGPKPPAKETDITDVLGANAACYVCHVTFIKEELAKTHLGKAVTCIKCHGPSEKHANDENIGATKPDITFKPDQVDSSCRQCHKGHNVSAGKVIARFQERKLATKMTPACTDCHGNHRIAKADHPR
jgi:hypothetical protein